MCVFSYVMSEHTFLIFGRYLHIKHKFVCIIKNSRINDITLFSNVNITATSKITRHWWYLFWGHDLRSLEN